MATYGTTPRRGLPRTAGGEPWPAGGAATAVAEPEIVEPVAVERPVVDPAERDETPVASARLATAAVAGTAPVAEPVDVREASTVVAAAPPPSGVGTLRRGLPRTPGGDPWPPAGAVAAAGAAPAAAAPLVAEPVEARAPSTVAAEPTAPPEPAPSIAPAAGVTLRRGLPRTPGGEPWPPAGAVAAIRATEPAAVAVAAAPATRPAPEPEPATAREVAASVIPEAAPTPEAAPVAQRTPSGIPLTQPLPYTKTVWAGKSAFTRPAPRPEPKRYGPFTRLQWAGAVIVGGAGLLFAAGMAVLFVRWLLSLQGMQDFLTAYPGEYPLPAGSPVGIPPWLGWQHFFNVFLIVLIIRSGMQVRTEKRPTAFWSRRSSKRKISLNLWFHQSLDILWIVNGVIFIVLLIATGMWVKIVPTSWAVFPNAVSAALQYVSLQWPTENGWVNYNSLQQLAYFATVFLAAPLAIATGVRMSGVWPKNAKTLNRAYPVEWARAVHFPVMLYFVAFIIVHVTLVFATGALRNLNHMYASSDAVNWVGFWIFVASLVVIAAGWVAARPLVLAPIARLFGSVSGR